MREIKVRGLSVEELVGNDQWVYGFGVNFTPMSDGSTDAYLYTSTHGVYEVHPESVGQYIGLKDKNGIEIYEGDVVTCREGSDTGTFTGYVHFENGQYWVNYIGYESYYLPLAKLATAQYEPITVLGNQFEHPHLLEGRDRV